MNLPDTSPELLLALSDAASPVVQNPTKYPRIQHFQGGIDSVDLMVRRAKFFSSFCHHAKSIREWLGHFQAHQFLYIVGDHLFTPETTEAVLEEVFTFLGHHQNTTNVLYVILSVFMCALGLSAEHNARTQRQANHQRRYMCQM